MTTPRNVGHIDAPPSGLGRPRPARRAFGPLGWLLDVALVWRRWDAGIQAFFAGLKRHVEAHPPA